MNLKEAINILVSYRNNWINWSNDLLIEAHKIVKKEKKYKWQETKGIWNLTTQKVNYEK